ncbi:hypothetical protein BaRGS_00010018 [Batillaria attramentaria]|uniref:Uncharacterized protein n=1 Tax=Batillaria attramentaria TaxID=370345 RepID=A0ABD0LGJ3_9CAEN
MVRTGGKRQRDVFAKWSGQQRQLHYLQFAGCLHHIKPPKRLQGDSIVNHVPWYRSDYRDSGSDSDLMLADLDVKSGRSSNFKKKCLAYA